MRNVQVRLDEETNSCSGSEPTAIYVWIVRILLAGAYFARLNPLQSVESSKA